MKDYSRLYENNKAFLITNNYRKQLYEFQRNGSKHPSFTAWGKKRGKYSEFDNNLLASPSVDKNTLLRRTSELRTLLVALTKNTNSMLKTASDFIKLIGKENLSNQTKYKLGVLKEQLVRIELKSKNNKLIFEQQHPIEKRANLEDTLEPLTNFSTFFVPQILESYIKGASSLDSNDELFQELYEIKEKKNKEKAKLVLENKLIPAIRTSLFYLEQISLRFANYHSAVNPRLQEDYNTQAHSSTGFYTLFTQISSDLNQIIRSIKQK